MDAFIKFPKVECIRSIFPFDCGRKEVVLICLIFKVSSNCCIISDIKFCPWSVRIVLVTPKTYIDIQGEAHKVLQSDSTQTIDHIQKCFRQKFQCFTSFNDLEHKVIPVKKSMKIVRFDRDIRNCTFHLVLD